MFKVAGGIILALVLIFVVAPIMCGMCVIGGGAVIDEQEKAERVEQKAAVAASAPMGESVMYESNCNVRSSPKVGRNKVGLARKSKAYPVTDVQGKWKKITLDNGTTGWCGCSEEL